MLRHDKSRLTKVAKLAFSFAILGYISNDNAAVATFSIAATDVSTGEIGAAGASCVSVSVYDALYQGVPGHGVVLTQAKPPADASPVYPLIEELLMNDTEPVDLIAAITDPELDNTTESVNDVTFEDYQLRQYGVANLDGRASGYTGESITDYYEANGFTEELLGYSYAQNHFSGRGNNLTYSAQGNIVTEDTVAMLVDTFLGESDECYDMPQRLYDAIVEPFLMTQQSDFVGDVRCASLNNASAAGMFLHVDGDDGTEIVHIDIVSDDIGGFTVDPLEMFQQAFDAWREQNPCEDDGDSLTDDATTGSGLPSDDSEATDAATDSPDQIPVAPAPTPASSGAVPVLASGALATILYSFFVAVF